MIIILIVYKIFITLSNVKSRNMRMEEVNIRITSNKSPGLIIITKELHKNIDDFHYHLYLKFDKGLSKNTYKKELRNLFPEFDGISLDIQGVKNEGKLLDYLFKSFNLETLINYEKRDLIFCNKDPFSELRNLNIFKNLNIIKDIINFESFRKWSISSIKRADVVVKSRNKALVLWDISRNLIPCTKWFEFLYANPVKDLETTEVDAALEIIKKYKVRHSHQVYLHAVLYGLLLREGVYPYIVKIANPYIWGSPNIGKTSLLSLIQQFYHKDIFYFVGRRPNDFTNYNPSSKSILIWDDVFTVKSYNKDTDEYMTNIGGWSHYNLLKLLGHEEIMVDVKFKSPVVVPPSYNIIISNYRLFEENTKKNLLARIKKIRLLSYSSEDPTCNWLKISKFEFETLLKYIYINLVVTIEIESQKSFIHYIK